MALYLHLTVRYFSDRYHGAEWPPSPARLFQALVAGAKTGGPVREWSSVDEQALGWLEALGPPDILARRGRAGQRYTMFVPNNSLADGKSTKTSKRMAPKILDGHLPGQPDLVYRWQVADESPAGVHASSLDRIAARLRALGWGIDFAAAAAGLSEDCAQPDGLELFTPTARGGTSVSVPTTGFLAHLDECHQAFVGRISTQGIDPYTRPTRLGKARYRRAESWQPRRWIAFALQERDGGVFAGRWDQVQTVAAWLRHAAGEALLQEELDAAWVDSFVLGHTAPNQLGQRLSFVPLPSVGHQNSDGGVRRVLIVEPPGAAGSDAEGLDLLRIKLPGSALVDEAKRAPRAVLAGLTDRSKVLPFYIGAARVWESVTPVILHGHNADRGRVSLVKTDRLLRQAFGDAGIPEDLIAEIAFQRAPYWAGCEAATEIRVPRHLAQWPRVHVRVEFTEPVEGPVLAGIGRHCGIGVFAAK